MRLFDWLFWMSEIASFKRSGGPSLERYFLRIFHSEFALNNFLNCIEAISSRSATEISIKSVWIDGTPQACGTLVSGASVKCELADVLFIVQEVDREYNVLSRCGVLLQAKVADHFAQLGGGRSTNKERNLLECLDRKKPLSLYKDTSGKSPIETKSSSHSYLFSNVPAGRPCASGLRDTAAYLLVSKHPLWGRSIDYFDSPFLVGWPTDRRDKNIWPPISLEEAVQLLYQGIDWGRIILDEAHVSSCDWSRMVWDLLNGYADVLMKTHDDRPRVRSKSGLLFHSSGTMTFGPPLVPPRGVGPAEAEPAGRPSISTVVVTIRTQDEKPK